MMHETGLGPHVFGEVGQEGNDVVLCFALNFLDSVDVKCTRFAHCLGRFAGDYAKFCLGIAGMTFNIEPYFVFVFGRPDGGHLGTGIAWDHGVLRLFKLVSGPCPGRTRSLQQSQAFETGMTILGDNQVIVEHDPKALSRFLNFAGHLDVVV